MHFPVWTSARIPRSRGRREVGKASDEAEWMSTVIKLDGKLQPTKHSQSGWLSWFQTCSYHYHFLSLFSLPPERWVPGLRDTAAV